MMSFYVNVKKCEKHESVRVVFGLRLRTPGKGDGLC